MLIRITERCRMGCSHRLVGAHPAGKHMSGETFRAALSLAEVDGLALITGGEPTEHPDCCCFVEQAKARGLKTVLMSNGMFLEDAVLTERVLGLGVLIQVTNDDRFYPQRIKQVRHPKISYTSKISGIIPLGRAKNMSTAQCPVRQYPQCFNLRSATRYYDSIEHAIGLLRMNGKFCTPTIEYDGVVRAGESNECFAIGTVESTLDQMTRRLLEHDCDACGLASNLNAEQRRAIGLSEGRT